MPRRFAAAVLLLTALTAACAPTGHPTGRSAPAPTLSAAPAAGRAAEVARAWPGSAEQRAWESGYYPLNTSQEWLPRDAFHNGDDKWGFLAGQLDLRTPLPTAAPSGEVVWQGGAKLALPLLPAEQVFRGLTEGKPRCGGNQCSTRLAVTAVRAGTRTVDTSRGQATIPVWEFTIAGYAEPFGYPAVAPQQAVRPMPPTTPVPSLLDASGALWSGTSADGLTLTGTVGHGDCDDVLPGEVYETDDVVVLLAHVKSRLHPGEPCDLALRATEAAFRLSRPLGHRVVLGLYDGAPQAQQQRPGAGG